LVTVGWFIVTALYWGSGIFRDVCNLTMTMWSFYMLLDTTNPRL
jgi:hypothetical protein